MKKKIAILSSLLWASSAVMAQDEKPVTEPTLFEQFGQLSDSALSHSNLPQSTLTQESPSVFIEREVANTLTSPSLSNNRLLTDTSGQWSVSFDLNRLVSADHQFDFNSQFNPIGQTNYDWELGTSLVSPDQTSRFYVNYGNRKVPISISFDDLPSEFSGLQEETLNLGFEQKLNESWAVSIAYLKSDSGFDAAIGNGLAGTSQHQLNYLFDFDANNKLETVNFSPFNQDISQAGFLDDISAIQIKVSRQMSDSLVLSASAAQGQSDFMSNFGLNQQGIADLTILADSNALKSEQLALEGQYKLNERWSLDANLEHQVDKLNSANTLALSDFSQLDATTLDIGVQYQSSWDQVGVVIRIDLMNLLGVSQTQAGQMGLDQNGLKPFSFDSPKYIKVSGSINF